MQAGIDRTFNAGADLSASQYCIAKLDTTTANQVLVATTSTDKIAGIITGFAKDGKQNDAVVIQSKGFSAKIQMSASCNIGDLITATTAGQGIVTTTNKDFIVGRALEAAAAQNDVIEIEMLMCYLSAT